MMLLTRIQSFSTILSLSNDFSGVLPYSGYNLRGAISHLEVMFAIIKFANHSILLRGQINLSAYTLQRPYQNKLPTLPTNPDFSWLQNFSASNAFVEIVNVSMRLYMLINYFILNVLWVSYTVITYSL